MTILSIASSATKALFNAVAGVIVLTVACNVSAQQSMTADELAAFIEEKKAALDKAIEQRDVTLEKQAELDKKREEQLARQEEIEQELRSLCEEREEADPGSLDSCLQEMNLDAE